MFEVGPSPREITRLREIASRASGERIAVRYPVSYGGGRWLGELFRGIQTAHPRARFVRVPMEPDRVERVVLELASLAGDEAMTAVAASLRAEPDELEATLPRLASALGDAPLFVDGWSALRIADDTYDAGHALDRRLSGFQRWLAERARVIVDYDFAPPPMFQRVSLEVPGHDAPPSVLYDHPHGGAVNDRTCLWCMAGAPHTTERLDLWERFAPDVGVYNSALALLALQENPTAEVVPPAWKVRNHVASHLPDSAKDLLFLLGAHRRPLGDDVRAVLNVDAAAAPLLARLGLCERTAAGLALDPAWCDWCASELGARIALYHTRLATAFASLIRPESDALDDQALAVLEAHRHYLAAGDDEEARRFARYSAALLVEEGKQRSLLHRYGEAARLYQSVLDLSEHGALPLGRRMRGYVRHYIHFNRARAKSEPLADTERGYREALAHWPENALFWSRLVRAEIYAGKTSRALETLATALVKVPPHAEKEAVLVARTVRGLLERSVGDHLVDAVLIWRDYVPTNSYTREVATALERALASGWHASVLSVPEVGDLVFFKPQLVKITRSAHVWIGELVNLDSSARARTAKDALVALIAHVRDEVKRYVSALTHTLDADERWRKQVLLGAIDIVASNLDAHGPARVWVLGDVHREGGSYWLRTKGTRDLWFEIPAELAAQTRLADLPYLAEVGAGPSGTPQGPVLRMEVAYGSIESLWEEWRRRSSRGT